MPGVGGYCRGDRQCGAHSSVHPHTAATSTPIAAIDSRATRCHHRSCRRQGLSEPLPWGARPASLIRRTLAPPITAVDAATAAAATADTASTTPFSVISPCGRRAG